MGRLADMLRSMSEETQFVIVTHSKRMMTAADMIYGVTMQEPGDLEGSERTHGRGGAAGSALGAGAGDGVKATGYWLQTASTGHSGAAVPCVCDTSSVEGELMAETISAPQNDVHAASR